ncbi:MAG: helix-turn-helix transcriptional regulator [Firmicutes bacterium]|nr:helix-turn-helix transcriptional regulator [Bacillota bacterium]
MTTESFAKFIKEERTRLGMTQAELAEKLHVSTAAVSKWEREKCLPDITKLEDIAAVLGLSVLEVLQCARNDEETCIEILPVEHTNIQDNFNTQLAAVYRETVDFAARQNMTRLRRFLKWSVVVLLIALLINWFPVYHVVQVWFPSYYTTGEISKLVFRGSPQDLVTASEIMQTAENACEELGLTWEEAKEKYGPLSRYCHAADSYPDVVDEWHEMKLWSAHFDLTEGWMWVYYSQEGLDEKGEVTTGSWRIPSLWYLQPDEEGNWKVVHIKEHA